MADPEHLQLWKNTRSKFAAECESSKLMEDISDVVREPTNAASVESDPSAAERALASVPNRNDLEGESSPKLIWLIALGAALCVILVFCLVKRKGRDGSTP